MSISSTVNEKKQSLSISKTLLGCFYTLTYVHYRIFQRAGMRLLSDAYLSIFFNVLLLSPPSVYALKQMFLFINSILKSNVTSSVTQYSLCLINLI